MTDRLPRGLSAHSGDSARFVRPVRLPLPTKRRNAARLRFAAVVLAAALLPACAANQGGDAPSGGASAPATASVSSPAPPAPATPPGSLDPDAEASVPAPAPGPATPSSGPGLGNAELAITLRLSPQEPEVRHTLVCVNGAPASESQHPAGDTACSALKENAALLSPVPERAGRVCTEQYGGPHVATVTGVVDGVPVDAAFARTNGCEISAWDAAKDVLGAAGGAA